MTRTTARLGLASALFGGSNEEMEAAVRSAHGRRIAAVRIDPDRRRYGALLLRFEDGSVLEIYDCGCAGSERRWMDSDDELTELNGGSLLAVEVRSGGPTPRVLTDEEYSESQFLLVTTTAGRITVVTHNEHNGYYGGFVLEANLFRSWDEYEEGWILDELPLGLPGEPTFVGAPPATPSGGMVSAAEAASILGTTTERLAELRCRQTGPAYVKLADTRVRYRRADLAAFAASSHH